MAKNFHVNPDTGEVGRCRAFFECRFKGKTDHFPTPEAAREAYEKANSHQTLAAVLKKRPPASSKTLESYRKLFPKNQEERMRGHLLSFKDGRHKNWQNLYNAMRADPKWRPYADALDVYYGEESSAKINQYLREGSHSEAFKGLPPSAESAYYDTMESLDSYIKAFEKHSKPEIVYKGATVKSEVEYQTILRQLSKLTPGSRMMFRGYTSTSLSVESASMFMRGKGVLYEIYSTKSAFMDADAEEVLLRSGATFTYVDYELLEDNRGILVRLKQED